MFVSVLETLCTVTPRVHCSPGHSMTMTPPIMRPVTRLTGSLHTPQTVVSENTARHLWTLEICFLSYDSQAFYQV